MKKGFYSEPFPSTGCFGTVGTLAFPSTIGAGTVAFPSVPGMINGADPEEEFESLAFESTNWGAWGLGVMLKSSTSKVKVSFGPIELFPFSA